MAQKRVCSRFTDYGCRGQLQGGHPGRAGRTEAKGTGGKGSWWRFAEELAGIDRERSRLWGPIGDGELNDGRVRERAQIAVEEAAAA